MSKVALAIIAKDEVEKVKAIIDNLSQYFDEICIAADLRLQEFKALESEKVKVFSYTWKDDFADKRNFLASCITSPIYLRLDTDDTIENPQLIPELVSFMDRENFDIFYSPYIYAKDEHGNNVAKHWRETLIRKRPDVYWKKRVHENVFVENKDETRVVRDERLKIIHNITPQHAADSFERNMKILLAEFKEDGIDSDPRTIAYLGRMLMAKGKWQEAILFLENLVKRSGWDDDIYFAWIQMAQCYLQLDKVDISIGCCNEALAINTKFPDAYLQMGAVYLKKGDYHKAVDWIMPGIVRPEPDTVQVVDPSFYGYKARMNAALALLGKGDIVQAHKYYQESKAMCGGDPYILGWEKTFVDSLELDQYLKSVIVAAKYTSRFDLKKAEQLVSSMPRQVFVDERASAIRNMYTPGRTWAKNEIAIFCGLAWEDWSPVSTVKGIGGSEEAVIYLSRELTKLGYKVTVFNMCGELAGDYEGVVYKNYHEFSLRDKYNILIGWRGDSIGNINARFKAIWLHDVPQEGQFTEKSIKSIDKIIVLSEFHKSLLPPFIPEDKIFVSSNGINFPDFEKNGVLRDPKRVIYTSSYDRGIQHLLLFWPKVRQAVPDATLHLFYGWNTYDEMMKAGHRDPKFRQAMTQLMQQEGVTEHGRVGHKQLVKEFQKSGVWAYPSHFEEISCISAMKAQAAGCVPVCTDYAALSETVKAGIKVKGNAKDAKVQEEFGQKLIEILQDNDEQEKIRQDVLIHKADFGWDRVAQQWSESLFPAEVRQ